MLIGLIGSGRMATALARGWREPVLCADPVAGRAEALAAEVGGEALPGNAELARRADLVVLCHKPAQLAEVAAEIAPRAVASILAATPLAALREAYPAVPVFRFIPNVAVAVRRGVLGYARQEAGDPELERRVLERFARVGTIVPLDDGLMDTAMALMSTSPAFFALVVEALVEAGLEHGVPAEDGARLVVEAMAGTAALLEAGEGDTLELRRSVTSPGGATARGLARLEEGGVRAALAAAVRAVVDR